WLLADSFVNGLSFVGGVWRDLAQLSFNLNLSALEAYLRGSAGAVPFTQCLAVLLAYTLGFTLLAVVVFRRRDIAG
ncbi:MAG TPA: hypothetical protein VJ754_00035, partial [Anaerolineae bacterium]|nr:hypothetical protein [Anaerolineae bacterium]